MIIFGVTNFFCVSGYRLQIDSQKYKFILDQKDMNVFQVLGTYYPVAFQKGYVNLLPQEAHERHISLQPRQIASEETRTTGAALSIGEDRPEPLLVN